MLSAMKPILVLVLLLVIIGAGLKMGGVPLPLVDYPIGPIRIDGRDPGMPDVQVEPPGFDDFEAP